MAELGSDLGGAKITFDITFTHVQANTHTHRVFEINLQNNNSFICILSMFECKKIQNKITYSLYYILIRGLFT